MLVHFLCIVLGAGSIYAQTANKTITGTVTDEAGTPLPGVSISVKGTSMGAVTDVAGKYSISLPANASTLVFSFIGFEAKEVAAGNRNTLSVSLSPQASSLNEVVVVGYATQKKVNLTGSVANVNFKELENTPQSNTLNILSGRVAGLSVVQPGGQPGDDTPEVFVRGLGTLNDASPLVIIDGVQATLKDLGNLTPQEIGEISVLKDASSAAIYGARGANGVILVTTKTPGKGKLRINLNSYYGLQEVTYMPEFVESWQWLTLHGEATGNLAPQTMAMIEKLKNGQYSDSAANTNWYKETFRKAPISNYNISVNGGGQNLSFQGSLGYQQQEG
ncbi:MAG: carboxypeptidase-like regulatory domain-containing protein, partial [Adhaeribacter sp.]